MIQQPDLDTKNPSSLPSNLKKQNNASSTKISNHLISATKSQKSPIYNQQVSPKDLKDLKETNKASEKEANADVMNGHEQKSEKNSTLVENGSIESDKRSQNHQENNSRELEEQGFLPVLKNPNFLALWGGQVFCQLADKVYLVLMIALINSQFQGEQQTISAWVSALMMAFTIPAVLFGSVAGVFVDRWSKKSVLVSTNVWRGILVLSIPLLLWLTSGWQPLGKIPIGFVIILGVTFLVSTLTQFFAPAEQAAIPLIVEEKHLLSANSLYTTTMMASVIVGFAVGEPLLATAERLWQRLGGTGGLGKELVVGGSYGIAGLILLLLVSTKEKPNLNQDKPKTNIFVDLKDGFRYLAKNTRLRNALIQLVILFSVFAALTVLAVRLAEVIPNLKSSQFGILLAAGGVGIAVGAGSIGQFGQRFTYNQLSLWGTLGMSASLTGLSIFTQQLWMVLLFVCLMGIFSALVGIPMQTVIQSETPPEMRGKVFGLQNNVTNIALSLPLGLAGIAESFIGLKSVFLCLAAIVFSGYVLNWYNSQK